MTRTTLLRILAPVFLTYLNNFYVPPDLVVEELLGVGLETLETEGLGVGDMNLDEELGEGETQASDWL